MSCNGGHDMLTNSFAPAMETADHVCDEGCWDEPRPQQLSPLGFVELSSLFIDIKVHFPCVQTGCEKNNN